MALPTLDATFASAANLPRRQMLANWLVKELGSGSIADYWDLPERYLWAKIAVAAGGAKDEATYISLPKQHIWKDIYDAISGSSDGTIDWSEKQALGHIAAAYRGDTETQGSLATYIDWPWRYQVASIIEELTVDSDVVSFVAASGATDVSGLNKFVKGVKSLGLWDSIVFWPLRSSQNSGTGTTAYSLGGLGTYNGTLINGPTWGVDGVNFADNTLQHILTTLEPSKLEDCNVFAAYQCNPTGVTPNNVAGCRTSGSQFFTCGVASSTLWGSSPASASQAAITDGSYNTAYFRYSDLSESIKTVGFKFNSLDEVTVTRLTFFLTTTPVPFIFGAENGTNGRALSGNLPFVSYIRLSTVDNEALRNLYKQTLGVGLGLP